MKDQILKNLIRDFHELSRRRRRIMIKIIRRRLKSWWQYRKKLVILVAFIVFILITLTFLAVRNRVQIIDNSTHTHSHSVSYVDTLYTQAKFLEQLKYVESRGNHLARRLLTIYDTTPVGVDTLQVYAQYIGYYQMGYEARRLVGYGPTKVSEEEFWQSPEIQENAMLAWIKYLKRYLQPYIDKYDHQWVGNYYITESGLIAMAHLCGIQGTIDFLNSKGTYIFRDGNGKPGVDYLQQFGRYRLELDK